MSISVFRLWLSHPCPPFFLSVLWDCGLAEEDWRSWRDSATQCEVSRPSMATHGRRESRVSISTISSYCCSDFLFLCLSELKSVPRPPPFWGLVMLRRLQWCCNLRSSFWFRAFLEICGLLKCTFTMLDLHWLGMREIERAILNCFSDILNLSAFLMLLILCVYSGLFSKLTVSWITFLKRITSSWWRTLKKTLK